MIEKHQLPTQADACIERVLDCELPESVESIVADYEATVGERDRFLWQWLYYLFPEIRLSSVAPADADRVREAKLLASIFVVVLDDLGERQMDRETFEEGSKIPFPYQSANLKRNRVDVRCLGFARRTWQAFVDRLADAPRYEEFERLFYYDVHQNVDAIDYSYTVNQCLEMATLDETEIHDCHNMMLLTYANVDLMFSPSFDREDLATLRRVLRTAQRMARIGNWVTTWERELAEGDFSSGVVVAALERGVVSRSDLYALREEQSPDARQAVVEAIRDANVEEALVEEWHREREEIARLVADVASVDVASYLSGMETIMTYHQASRGLK